MSSYNYLINPPAGKLDKLLAHFVTNSHNSLDTKVLLPQNNETLLSCMQHILTQ